MSSNRSMQILASAVSVGLLMAMTAATSHAATYDLCAGETTVTMPPTAAFPLGEPVTMWGFGLTVDGACTGITVPGPRLDVPPGESLTVNLTNTLPAGVSIVIPGQITDLDPVMFTDGQGRSRVRSFTTETATGDTGVYEWLTVRPGTYVYHSGTHPQIQVQMGLYGSVVNDSAAGEAYPGEGYDAEVMLYYSEIDPALHAAVAGGTYGTAAMPSAVNYRPQYFLVNGAPYSSATTPLAAGAAGERTLLRLVNMGLQTHTPVVQGMHASLIAEDGNPYPFARQQYSIMLGPTKTVDAIIVPAADGTYAVYDRQLSLTNSATSPGGLLSYLSVGAGSGAGPLSTTLLYFSTLGNYALPGVSGPADRADIYSWNGSAFARVFDGSAAGLRPHANIDALEVVDEDTFYMSFARNAGTRVPGLGWVGDEDIVLYDAGTWSLYFDGSAMGLAAAADVDGFEILDGGSLVVSFTGGRRSTGLAFAHAGEDLLRCNHSGGASVASCTWSLYFDASDVSLMAGTGLRGAAVDGNGLYLTTADSFAITGLSGQGRDVSRCDGPTTGKASACASFTPIFDGGANGLDETTNASLIDAIDLR